jgi:ribosomal protein L11 methyltransferase
MLYKAIFEINKELEDEYSEKIFALGAQSVSASFENDKLLLEAIFDEELLEIVESSFLENNYEIIKVEEHDWKDKWLENFEGVLIENSVMVIPEGNDSFKHKYEGQAKTIIELDPRDVFGSGSHPTTYLCIKLLKGIFSKNKIHSLVDIGTGSGVLAIFADKSGVPNIAAFDNSPESVEKSKYNAKLNNCQVIDIYQADLFEFDNFEKKYDVVAANILTTIIQQNIDKLIKLMADAGFMVLSGISTEWRDEVLEIFKKAKLQIVEEDEQEGWLAFLLTK